MKPAVWIGLAVIVAALAFGARAFVTNLTPYVGFEQARRAQGAVQVMGKLDKKSVVSNGKTLDFTLVDKEGDRIAVTYAGPRAPNFDQAIEVTARGAFDGKAIRADTLLVKCPTKYQGTDTKEYGSVAAQAQPSFLTGSGGRPSFGN